MEMQPTSSHIGGYDVQTPLAELLGEIQAGEDVAITKAGTPVARLIPVEGRAHSQQARAEAIQRLVGLSKGLTLKGLKVRNMIDEGRL